MFEHTKAAIEAAIERSTILMDPAPIHGSEFIVILKSVKDDFHDFFNKQKI